MRQALSSGRISMHTPMKETAGVAWPTFSRIRGSLPRRARRSSGESRPLGVTDTLAWPPSFRRGSRSWMMTFRRGLVVASGFAAALLAAPALSAQQAGAPLEEGVVLERTRTVLDSLVGHRVRIRTVAANRNRFAGLLDSVHARSEEHTSELQSREKL